MAKPKNKNLTKVIFTLLYNNPELRDDLVSTIRVVHDIEICINGILHKGYYYAIFFTEKLSNVHTIKRLWQLVQESRADLRGETWAERQKQGGMVAKEMVELNIQQLKLFPK